MNQFQCKTVVLVKMSVFTQCTGLHASVNVTKALFHTA
jgi:hypothetical protein